MRETLVCVLCIMSIVTILYKKRRGELFLLFALFILPEFLRVTYSLDISMQVNNVFKDRTFVTQQFLHAITSFSNSGFLVSFIYSAFGLVVAFAVVKGCEIIKLQVSSRVKPVVNTCPKVFFASHNIIQRVAFAAPNERMTQ